MEREITDTERLDWLHSMKDSVIAWPNPDGWGIWGTGTALGRGPTLREAIDAAMLATPEATE